MTLQDRKNAEISAIERKLEKLEQVMIDERDKGQGYSPKAKRASNQYEKLQDEISYIQFHKYRNLEPPGSRYARQGYHNFYDAGVKRKSNIFDAGEYFGGY